MLQDHPHAIHFKHTLYFGEGQPPMPQALTAGAQRITCKSVFEVLRKTLLICMSALRAENVMFHFCFAGCNLLRRNALTRFLTLYGFRVSHSQITRERQPAAARA
jgi:hypothetical protein